MHASGLNFRDVLLALGLYPGEVPRLGSDGAGEVVAVGAGVTGLAVGDRVVAMVEGAFATHATTRAEFVAPLPAEIPYERAASLPSAWLTAEITLNQIARLQAGQRVLVHAGAGGVGMAAVALALRAGAEVFATAGSDEKRAVLAAMGVPHVLDSRSPAFADEVLRRTGGVAPVPALLPQGADDTAALDTPIEEEFRVGTMSLSWDGEASRVVIEAFSTDATPELDEDDDEAEESSGLLDDDEDAASGMVLRVRLTGAQARAFAKRALAVVAAGRPPCPFCAGPLDPEGHICPRANGYRR